MCQRELIYFCTFVDFPFAFYSVICAGICIHDMHHGGLVVAKC